MAILVISVGLVACGPEEPSNPEPTTLSVSEPEGKPQEPVAEPEPTQKPEPEVTPEPEPVVEPVVESEPEPVAEPEPTQKPEPVVESEPEAEPVTAVSITAKVSEKHTVGETLSATDFTITVNMSDGSTVKNPAGWNANPLTLSSESTVITVTYNGLSTTVTVTASQPAQQPAVQEPQPEPQPSVGEPPLPSGGWPASAYGPVTDAAIADCYNYALAHGWTAEYRSTDAFVGWSGYVYVKNGVEFLFDMGDFLITYEWWPAGGYSMQDVYTYIDSVN